MTLIYSDPIFEQHQTGAHPETPERLASVRRLFSQANIQPLATPQDIAPQEIAPQEIAKEKLELSHDTQQIKVVEQLCQRGGGALDADTICSSHSYSVARRAAATACLAVDQVLSGKDSNALCLIRPPGHHATPTQSMGFCLFNNIAIAAQHALTEHSLDRVLIVDWDVHHGNGTQDFFYDREEVYFYSMHRFPFYPGSGAEDERGSGRGLGTTQNLPIAFGTSRQEILARFQTGLETAIGRFKPDLVLISAGFDAHEDDPIGSLGLKTEDFAILTQAVLAIADQTCHGRIVSCLEGGYHLQALRDSVAAHIDALRGASPPE